MRNLARLLAVAAALIAGAIFAAPGHAAEKVKSHHIAYQIDQNDPELMNLVLNNVSNMMQYYHSKGEQAEIEVVAYGPGLNMLRDDKSPVKERLKQIKQVSFPSSVTYSACHVTMMGMEKKEGHPITLVSEARVVPGGVVRLTELQEAGWSYIRP
jgi:intracellular sulfur oxidation DsrE/DsrF family protein